MLDKFLDDDSQLKPVGTKTPLMTDAGPVAPFVPVKPASPAASLQN
jgi:hypothetical protein